MADKKITELVELSLPSYGDIFPIVHDPLGTPVNNYTTISNLIGSKNAFHYGVTGDGVTDDTAAIQAFLDLGGDLYFPEGTYLFSDNLEYVDNSYIHGDGRGATIFKQKDSSNITGATGMLQPEGYGGAVFPAKGYWATNVTLRGFSVDGNTTNNTGAAEGIVMIGVKDGLIDDVETYNCTEVGINASGYWTDFLTAEPKVKWLGVVISNCFSHNNDADGFQFAMVSMLNCTAYNNGTGGFLSIITGAVFDDTVPRFTSVSNCIAYYNADGFANQYQGDPSNSTNPTVFVNCSGIKNTQAGYSGNAKNNHIIGGHWDFNGLYGIILGGANDQSEGAIVNAIIKNNTGPGIVLDREHNNLLIQGNTIIDDQASPSQTYGISYDNYIAGSNIKIKDNQFAGNLTAAIHPDLIDCADYEIRGNTGYNPVGVSAITVGTSPYTYTAGASPEEVYITGGTVSDVSKSSTTIAAASPCRVHLEPHQAVVVTYSSKPTMVKDIL